MSNMESYTCTKGKDGRYYVFRVDENGKKTRVSNDYISKCQGIRLESCKDNVCDKDNDNRYPCKVKRTTFVSKKDAKDYCKTRKTGPYKSEERAKIIQEANEALKTEMAEKSSRSMPRIQFGGELPAVDKPRVKLQSRRKQQKAAQGL